MVRLQTRQGHLRKRALVGAGVVVSGFCAGVLVALPNAHTNLRSTLEQGPPLPLTQLPAMTVNPRTWVSITVPAKEVTAGSSTKMLPPPVKDPYADFVKEDANDDENPHHIFMTQAEKDRGAVATWKTGAEADKVEEDNEDDNSERYRTTITVNPLDARRGAYVRYVQGGPPGVQESDAAKASARAAAEKAKEEAALDDEPLLRPPKIGCTNRNPLGLDPPPCVIAPAEKKDGVFEDDDDVYN